MLGEFGNLSNNVSERCTSTRNGLFTLFGSDFEQILGQIVFLRVKTLSNTNLVQHQDILKEKKAHFWLTCVA